MLAWLQAKWAGGPGGRIALTLLAAFLIVLAVTAGLSLAYGPNRVQTAVCGRAGCWGS